METLLGYLPFLAMLLGSGYGIDRLCGLCKNDGSMVALGRWLALGLAFNSVVLLGMCQAFGLGVGTLAVETVGGTDALLFVLALLLKKASMPRLERKDIVVTISSAILGVTMLGVFVRAPYFPLVPSVDFGQHLDLVTAIMTHPTPFPTALLYQGMTYLLALGHFLTGIPVLVSIRYTMSLMVVLTSFVVYWATSVIFSRNGVGIIASFLYCFTGFAWFVPVLNAGLYPNFFGLLISLSLLAMVMERKSWGMLGATTLMTLAELFTHYSSVLLLPVVIGWVSYWSVKVHDKPNLVYGGIMASLGVGASLVPNIVQTLLMFRVQTSDTTISLAMPPQADALTMFLSTPQFNFFQFFAALVYDPVAVLILFLLSGIFIVWSTWTHKTREMSVGAWFLTCAVLAPVNGIGWRFTVVALMPAIGMSAWALWMLFKRQQIPREKKFRKFLVSGNMRQGKVMLGLVLIGGLVLGSWWVGAVAYGFFPSSDGTTPSADGLRQTQVYQALLWMRGHTTDCGPHENKTCFYMSVSDWRFEYSRWLSGSQTTYAPTLDPAAAVRFAVNNNLQYIIVTNQPTLNMAGIPPEDWPWNAYNNRTMPTTTVVYSNPDVHIFKLVNLGA